MGNQSGCVVGCGQNCSPTIGNDKSASGHFPRLLLTRARPAPDRCDHSRRSGTAVCNRGTARSSAQKRGRAGTGSVPVHHLPGGTGRWHRRAQIRRKSCGATDGSPQSAAFFFTIAQITLGVKPSPQILPALLIERSRGPVLIPAALVQSSAAALTQSG